MAKCFPWHTTGLRYTLIFGCEMLNSSLVRMAFYDGSDGPRLMLFGPLEVDLISLQTCFHDLAKDGGIDSIQLDQLPWIHTAEGVKVRLLSCDLKDEFPKRDPTFCFRKIATSSNSYEWKQTKEGWQFLGDLIQGLLDSKTPCHQYLSSYPSDDAIVVVSKGEYTDNVLED